MEQMTAQISTAAHRHGLRGAGRCRERWRAAAGEPPGLAVILVGNDPASEIYVKGKRRDCDEVGFHSNFSTCSETSPRKIWKTGVRASTKTPASTASRPDHRCPRTSTRPDHRPHRSAQGRRRFPPYNIGRLALAATVRVLDPQGHHAAAGAHRCRDPGSRRNRHRRLQPRGRPMGLELLLAGCTVTTAHKFSKDTAACADGGHRGLGGGQAGLVPGAGSSPAPSSSTWVSPGMSTASCTATWCSTKPWKLPAGSRRCPAASVP